MRKAIIAGMVIAAVACAPAISNVSNEAPGAVVEAWVPTGAKIEPSGFATIETASPAPVTPNPPATDRPKDERSYYARLANVSETEAAKRLAEQEKSRPQFERLLRTLRAREAGNFTDARMIHTPDWAYVFYFKRDPERTLARHTRYPHFKAGQARFSTAELDAIAKPWVTRFNAERLLTGFGTDATYGEVRMDLVVSEAEYKAIAARQGWGPLPEPIKLEFAKGAAGTPVAREVAPLVRIFPHSDRALGITNQALLGGRIVLRDGCLWVTGPAKPDRLAYFPREFGLGVDGENYLAIVARDGSGKIVGRIGEEFNWGGPIGLAPDAPMVAELRAACGNAPIEHVGMLSSAAAFRSRYGG